MSRAHWEQIYETRPAAELSWYQREPATSRRLVVAAASSRSATIVDVGSGVSSLVDRLLDDGHTDVTLVDLSLHALEAVRTRLGERADSVTFVCSDVLDWSADRPYDVWHDRAVFHFLTDDADRARYAERAAAAVRPGGMLIVASFAADGPTHCSGLPVRGHTADDLARSFADAFTLESAEREAHVTPAAVTQPFTWAVLRRD
jgi:2-polyprenyl-3-methyl-5-hydroxy-6-metoxy-1,4-benzoquinol methylase